MKHQISFTVAGQVSQQIEILQKDLTIEELLTGLRTKKYQPPLQHDMFGDVFIASTDGERVAVVRTSTLTLEESDFTVS